MDLAGLIREYRRRADDKIEPYLTSDEELARLATEAENEACVRARLIFDDSISIPVAAGQHTVQISTKVDRVTYASFTSAGGGRARELDLTGMDWVREQCDWSTRSSSRPRVLVHLAPTAVRLWPIPSVAGTLALTVYRYPRYEIEDLSDEPEIPEEHHLGLIDWMLYRVFDQKDGEQYDPVRSDRALSDFTNKFGERPSADVQRRHRERRRCTTRYHA